MDKIFLGKEHNPDLSSPEAFLIYYLTENCPATYFENDAIQCSGYRRRSLDDLNLLIASYFPDWDPENLFDTLVDIWKNNRHLLVCVNFCTNINKMVVVHNISLDGHPFVYTFPLNNYLYDRLFKNNPYKEYYFRFLKRWYDHPLCESSQRESLRKFFKWIKSKEAEQKIFSARDISKEVVEPIG